MKNIHIFDLDGTLLDSMPHFARGTLQVLVDEGIPYGDDLVDIITPLGDEKTALLFQEMGVPGTVAEIIHRIQQNQYPDYAYRIPLKPGIDGYLRKLKAAGCTLCVLTASPHILTDAALRRNGVYHLFDHVWSIDDFGLNKSQTALFDAVTARLGCDMGDIHFYDDNITAVTTAVKAGWYVWAVNDNYTEAEIAALRNAAHGYVSSFAELLPPRTYHIFDMDGTLTDSMGYIGRSVLQVLEENHIPHGPEIIDRVTPLGYPNTARLFQTMGVPGTAEEIVARFMEILHHEYAHHVPLKPGVADYLHRLKAEGKHLCVLTGSPHLLTDVCLQRNGIRELFDHVWSVDDFGISKDNPAIYQQVEQLLGCGGANITLYDDNRTACATAARSGWYTVGVQDRQKPEFLQQLKSTVDCYLTGFDVL